MASAPAGAIIRSRKLPIVMASLVLPVVFIEMHGGVAHEPLTARNRM